MHQQQSMKGIFNNQTAFHFLILFHENPVEANKMKMQIDYIQFWGGKHRND